MKAVETWLFYKMDGSDIFNRGDSVFRTVYLYNYDTESALDLDSLTAIQFEPIHAVTNRSLGTYTLAAGDINKDDAENGLASFKVGQSVSAVAKRGLYLLLVTTQETDPAFESNIRVRTGISVCFKLI